MGKFRVGVIGAALFTLTFLGGCAGGVAGVAMCAAGYCANEEPEKNLSADGACQYQSFTQTEFKIAPGQGDWIKYYALFDKGRKRLYQTPASGYNSLLAQPFKVIGTDAVTVETDNAAQTRYSYEDIELANRLFRLNKSYYTKVMTQDCSVYYLSMTPKDIKVGLTRSDGTKVASDDLKQFYGGTSLQSLPSRASVTYDNFEKHYKVETPIFNDLLLRGTVLRDSGKEVALQVYTTVSFSGEWANLDRAFSEDGERFSLTRITSEPDCSGAKFDLPCWLNETVGVNVSREFLEKHRSGVEIKLSGQRSKVIYVPGPLIVSLLDGLNDAQGRIKADS